MGYNLACELIEMVLSSYFLEKSTFECRNNHVEETLEDYVVF